MFAAGTAVSQKRSNWTRWAKLGRVGVVGVVLAVAAGASAGNGFANVAIADLPKQGQETYSKILSGGPFPYDKDGTVFGNREKLLPKEKRGFYREYTVKTPFSRDRGARRIVCGGLKTTAPEACYYTADHYASFKLIVTK